MPEDGVVMPIYKGGFSLEDFMVVSYLDNF